MKSSASLLTSLIRYHSVYAVDLQCTSIALFPGLPRLFVLRFAFSIIHGNGSFVSVYYTERKPKNQKWGRPGNEASSSTMHIKGSFPGGLGMRLILIHTQLHSFYKASSQVGKLQGYQPQSLSDPLTKSVICLLCTASVFKEPAGAACLISPLLYFSSYTQGYIRGYISHQHQKLVVSKQNPFPVLSSVLK